MYHLATYPTNHLSIWKSDEAWTDNVEMVQCMKSASVDLSNQEGWTKYTGEQKTAEASFFIAQFVIFSSDDMDEIMTHAALECIDKMCCP